MKRRCPEIRDGLTLVMKGFVKTPSESIYFILRAMRLENRKILTCPRKHWYATFFLPFSFQLFHFILTTSLRGRGGQASLPFCSQGNSVRLVSFQVTAKFHFVRPPDDKKHLSLYLLIHSLSKFN